MLTADVRDRAPVDHLQGSPATSARPQDHAGVIHSSNLCTEITLNTSAEETAVCNLGSIVLDSHLKDDGELDLEKLRETVRVAVRALDNVIDINFYPTESAQNANQRHRPVGLGVMGLQNALFVRNTPFASQEAVDFNDEFMEAIAYFAYEASSDLAAERGSYSTFEGSKWHRGMLPPDTLDLLEEERGEMVDVPRGGQNGLGRASRKDPDPGHAQQQCARDCSDCDDLKHHGQHAVHRTNLQEHVCEGQPLRRLHRAEPPPRR